MKEFFALNTKSDGKLGYLRPAEGAWSWQHLVQVGIFMILMVALAVWIGTKNKNKTAAEKNKVLVITAILIDSFEIIKIIVMCIRYQNPMRWIYILPLFLCSIQLIAIPMAAFCKGRIKEACLDFVLTFGILGAVFGTIGNVQNYTAYPVMSMDNVVAGITHSMSGFASLYISISGMVSMKKENYVITLSILLGFALTAYVVNHLIGYNYMFLMYHDNTPYSIFYNLVGGSPVLYPIIVVSIFVAYVTLYYYVYLRFIKNRKAAKKA